MPESLVQDRHISIDADIRGGKPHITDTRITVDDIRLMHLPWRVSLRLAKETRMLLDSIDVTSVAGLRDRAIIGVMVYSFGRVSVVIGMNVEDYFQQGKRWWFRLHEKGGTRHEVPAKRVIINDLKKCAKGANLAR